MIKFQGLRTLIFFDFCIIIKTLVLLTIVEDFKKADIWAEIKFVPADPNRKTVVECTKKISPEPTKFQKFFFHVKEILKLLK